MARRAISWKESLSEELQRDPEARHEFFLALLDEGYEWKDALNKIVKLIGVKEYAEMVGEMKSSNLINQLKKDHNMTIGTLEKITAPLHVSISFK